MLVDQSAIRHKRSGSNEKINDNFGDHHFSASLFCCGLWPWKRPRTGHQFGMGKFLENHHGQKSVDFIRPAQKPLDWRTPLKSCSATGRSHSDQHETSDTPAPLCQQLSAYGQRCSLLLEQEYNAPQRLAPDRNHHAACAGQIQVFYPRKAACRGHQRHQCPETETAQVLI